MRYNIVEILKKIGLDVEQLRGSETASSFLLLMNTYCGGMRKIEFEKGNEDTVIEELSSFTFQLKAEDYKVTYDRIAQILTVYPAQELGSQNLFLLRFQFEKPAFAVPTFEAEICECDELGWKYATFSQDLRKEPIGDYYECFFDNEAIREIKAALGISARSRKTISREEIAKVGLLYLLVPDREYKLRWNVDDGVRKYVYQDLHFGQPLLKDHKFESSENPWKVICQLNHMNFCYNPHELSEQIKLPEGKVYEKQYSRNPQ